MLPLAVGKGRLEADFTMITNLAAELFTVTEINVGNNFVSRCKVQGGKTGILTLIFHSSLGVYKDFCNRI